MFRPAGRDLGDGRRKARPVGAGKTRKEELAWSVGHVYIDVDESLRVAAIHTNTAPTNLSHSGSDDWHDWSAMHRIIAVQPEISFEILHT